MLSSNAVIESDRHECIDTARQQWMSRLMDLSRNNKLLYFKQNKTAMLDFNGVIPSALGALLNNEKVSLRQLFSLEQHPKALKTTQDIRRIARGNWEERGIRTLYLAIMKVTWRSPDAGRPPEAPVILLPISIESRTRNGDLQLERAGNPRINPVLLHALARESEHTPTELYKLDERDDLEIVLYLQQVARELAAFGKNVPGFQLGGFKLLGNFSFQKLVLWNELNQPSPKLYEHDVIAALANSLEGKQKLQAMMQPIDLRDFDKLPPESEFLILDADSSQQRVITAVLQGQSGVIQGPPGTGKSQTIANLLATLVADGKRVLFVAEKSAALHVVRERLKEKGLEHLAIDLHSAEQSKSAHIQQLARANEQRLKKHETEDKTIYRNVSTYRDRLNTHVRALHTPRQPSGKSVYWMQSRLNQLAPEYITETRWRSPEIERLTSDCVLDINDLLIDAGGISQLFLGLDPSPWARAQLTTGQHVQDALELVKRLEHQRLPKLQAAARAVAEATQLPAPTTIEQMLALTSLLPFILKTLNRYQPELFAEDLNSMAERLGPASDHWFFAIWALLANADHREAYRTASSYYIAGRFVWSWDLLADMVRAAKRQLGWQELLGDRARVPEPTQLEAALEALKASEAEAVQSDLATLATILRSNSFEEMTLTGIIQRLALLSADTTTPAKLPLMISLRRRLQQLGVQPFLLELRKRRPPVQKWPTLFEQAWISSCLDHVFLTETSLRAFNGSTHNQFVTAYRESDQQLVQGTAARLRHLHAKHVKQTMDQNPRETAVVAHELKKKKGYKSLRQMLKEAPAVVTALCPCWMASPLSVSQFIPTDQQYFDVIIFDEASQILPEDAIPALMRASTVVVAGDTQQLPPTQFFAAGDDEDTNDETATNLQNDESLLDLMSRFVEPWQLEWHYRSQDEKLIAFANHHIYNGELITFPSPRADAVISHEYVQWVPTEDNTESMGGAEANRVVELIFEHAEQRPGESLGVITLGQPHMKSIQKALDLARANRPELDDFFNDQLPKVFFIKNLETVQGDERDAIILSVGLGRNQTGKMFYNFGPLNKDGGERRLNVAITRARVRMTITSTFRAEDMNPANTSKRGIDLLRRYIGYAAAGGEEQYHGNGREAKLDAFETDVAQTLTGLGLIVKPHWGASKAYIQFAIEHPDKPGQFVLAIECDSIDYAESATARDRDRLRVQQLNELRWRYERIWFMDWCTRREETVARIMSAYQNALDASDAVPLAFSPEKISIV